MRERGFIFQALGRPAGDDARAHLGVAGVVGEEPLSGAHGVRAQTKGGGEEAEAADDQDVLGGVGLGQEAEEGQGVEGRQALIELEVELSGLME